MPEIRYSAQSKLSSRLVAMLNALQHNSRYVFHRPDADPTESLDDFRRNFSDQRRKVATSLRNPRILNINFKTLRHFKAMEDLQQMIEAMQRHWFLEQEVRFVLE
jgi:hypothetical protein